MTASSSQGVSRGGRIASAVLLTCFAVVCVIPLLWLVLAPSRTDAQISGGPPLAFGSLSGYSRAWDNLVGFDGGVIYHWFANSVLYAFGAVVVAVATATTAGYALATTQMIGRRALLVLTLIAMIVPSAALVLPLFLEVNAVHLTDTALSIILPEGLFPFGVYLAYIHFSTSIPRSLYEAARIDGASEWRLFVAIGLPLSRGLIGLLSFFAFVASWNNFFLPMVMLVSDQRYSLQLGLQTLMNSTPALNPGLGGSNLPIHRPEAAIAGIVTVLPVAIVFLVSQRYLARGILSGAVKD